jgi:hypothetical protein
MLHNFKPRHVGQILIDQHATVIRGKKLAADAWERAARSAISIISWIESRTASSGAITYTVAFSMRHLLASLGIQYPRKFVSSLIYRKFLQVATADQRGGTR